MEIARIEIKDFTVGNKIKTSLLIKNMDYLTYKDRPGQYLNITFQDRTGEISSKLWDNYQSIAEKCSPGTVVLVEGVVYDYKGLIQLQLEKIKIAKDFDPADFLPVSPRSRSEMLGELREKVDSVKNDFLKMLLEKFFLNKDLLKAFSTAPAAKQYHQAYLGGLLEHSLNVASLAEGFTATIKEADRDLLLTGALLHDIGKIREFKYETMIDYTIPGRLHGHIFIGAQMVADAIREIAAFPEELGVKLIHMILSHHGEYEWGSPKRPKFLEAQMLHRADLIDSEAYKFKEIQEDQEITFNKALGRYIVK